MKRIASQVITLPVLVTDGHELAAGKSQEEIEELDTASINYARNTAIPILEDNVLPCKLLSFHPLYIFLYLLLRSSKFILKHAAGHLICILPLAV